MREVLRVAWVVAVLSLWANQPVGILAADRTAGEILKEIDAVKVPPFDRTRSGDEAYVKEHESRRHAQIARKAALILELYIAEPDHQRVPVLMAERWGSMSAIGAEGNLLKQEVDRVLGETASQKLRVEAIFTRARIRLRETESSGSPDIASIDEFIKLAPRDRRGAAMLYHAATVTTDPQAKLALENRLNKEYPEYAATIEGTRRRQAALGKPFDLEFADAVTGAKVSTRSLKGRILVVDFWATWCGPCIADLPEMKEIYSRFHGDGVEFIGVSLDQSPKDGGLQALKTFVKERQVPWPQYYEGKGWDGEFHNSWGIGEIPTVFVVDPTGRVYSTEARGKLATILPELISARAAGRSHEPTSTPAPRPTRR
jgi:thiol-disulfide isomerase/thioredoxin